MTSISEKSPTRVLFLDHTAKLGGGEIALLNLIRNLDVTLVQPDVVLFEDGPLVERLRPYVKVHVLPLAKGVSSASKDGLGWGSVLRLQAAWLVLMHVWKVARFARRMRAEIVHTNSLKSDIIGGFAARLVGIPVVWHVRDRIEPDYLPPVVVSVFRFLAGALPNYVIANSASTLGTLRLSRDRRSVAISSGVQISEKSSVVHDGCEPEFADPIATLGKLSFSTLKVGLIGRISPWKGQHVFLRAASSLRVKHPHARFEIVGAPLFSEHAYEAELRTLTKSLDLVDIVTFTGFVNDVPERIAQLDILVHASTTAEPFGQVVIEAMAAGKPVVATSGGGVIEIVLDGDTGLLVPMGDAEKMADAIAWLIDNPEAARAMGQKGRERVLSHFTIQKTARMVEQVYCEMLAATPPRFGTQTEIASTGTN